jgi:hypothetical protein
VAVSTFEADDDGTGVAVVSTFEAEGDCVGLGVKADDGTGDAVVSTFEADGDCVGLGVKAALAESAELDSEADTTPGFGVALLKLP